MRAWAKTMRTPGARRSCFLSCVTLKLVFSSTTSDFSAENCIKQQRATWRMQGAEVSGDKVDLLVPLNTCIHKCNKFCNQSSNNNNKKNAKNKRNNNEGMRKNNENNYPGATGFFLLSRWTLLLASTTSDSLSAENCIKQQHAHWRMSGSEVSGDKVLLSVPLNTCIHKWNRSGTHSNNNNKNAKNKKQQWGHEQKQWEQLHQHQGRHGFAYCLA